MRLSKTSEYALRVLSFMINSNMQVFSAKYLVENLNVPDKYLRRIMTDMSKYGFIKSIQGREGGYVFAKNADRIFISDVIEAVEGMERYQGCILGFNNCSDDHPCTLHKRYSAIRENDLEFLNTTSIALLKDTNVLKF